MSAFFTTPDRKPARAGVPAGAAPGWQVALPAVLLVVAVVLAVHWDMVLFTRRTWNVNETYTHGYLIFPLSAWLIWRKRDALAMLPPRPAWWALLPLALGGLAWEMGFLARVAIVQQYAIVATIVAAVWVVLGTRVARAMAFPLGFLFLAVPFGEEFLPPLMNFTADFAVAALRLTGIPVFREGLHFMIPSGSWSVVEACSGLRYVIASITLGLLYAYLTYRSLRYRVVFVVLSVVIPVLANGIRAYLIVMIGHLSDMKLAVGVDHLIYGWIFFGLVMLLLFWAGSFWREDHLPEPEARAERAGDSRRATSPALLGAAVASVAVMGIWPVYAALLESSQPGSADVALAAPAASGQWALRRPSPDGWNPHVSGERGQVRAVYAGKGGEVTLHLYYFRRQENGRELVTAGNAIVFTGDKTWNKVGESRVEAGADGRPAIETLIAGGTERRVARSWMWVGGEPTVNRYRAKWLESLDRLLGRGDDAALIVVSAPYEGRPDAARALLSAYLRDMMPAIEATLDATRRQAGGSGS